MTDPMTNREICLKAAARLREVGWRQGDFGGPDGPHCILGACRWATGYYAAYAPYTCARPSYAAITAITAITAADGVDYDVTNWNDAPGRTAEEVIAALEACP